MLVPPTPIDLPVLLSEPIEILVPSMILSHPDTISSILALIPVMIVVVFPVMVNVITIVTITIVTITIVAIMIAIMFLGLQRCRNQRYRNHQGGAQQRGR